MRERNNCGCTKTARPHEGQRVTKDESRALSARSAAPTRPRHSHDDREKRSRAEMLKVRPGFFRPARARAASENARSHDRCLSPGPLGFSIGPVQFGKTTTFCTRPLSHVLTGSANTLCLLPPRTKCFARCRPRICTSATGPGDGPNRSRTNDIQPDHPPIIGASAELRDPLFEPIKPPLHRAKSGHRQLRQQRNLLHPDKARSPDRTIDITRSVASERRTATISATRKGAGAGRSLQRRPAGFRVVNRSFIVGVLSPGLWRRANMALSGGFQGPYFCIYNQPHLIPPASSPAGRSVRERHKVACLLIELPDQTSRDPTA